MLDRLDRTIAAVASAPGPGMRGIIRVSGVAVRAVVERTVDLDDATGFQAVTRPARHLGTVTIGSDHVLRFPVSILLWPHRKSFTGEPMAEVHMLGSPPLLEAVLSQLFDSGAIPAEPGEFTLRAFLNGRIDLVQAEAVLGVINASNQEVLNLALSQLAGGLSSKFATLREQLLIDLADLEAGLDFVDEDIEFVQRDAMTGRLKSAVEFVDRLRSQAEGRYLTSFHHRVLLAGLPNAGKSSFFNALLGTDQALVSSTPGTTRDYLTAQLNWFGVPVELIDTAGWEAEAVGPLAEGLVAREDQWRRSDLIVWCSACDQSLSEAEVDQTMFAEAANSNGRVLRLWTKCDLEQADPPRRPRVCIYDSASVYRAKAAFTYRLAHLDPCMAEILVTTGARCRDCLTDLAAALNQALSLATTGADDTLIAFELRAALEELGTITGQAYTDDILDRIFSRFCIGK